MYMTYDDRQQSTAEAHAGKGKVFGVPLGDLGFFSSVLIAFTLSFITFFLVTFLAIVGMMIYNGMGHHANYANAYKLISFPIACVMLAVSLIFFGTLWVRRKFSGH